MTLQCSICGDEITSMLLDKSAAGDLGTLLAKHVRFRHVDSFTEYLAETQLLIPMIPYYLLIHKFANTESLPDHVIEEINKCPEILTKTLGLNEVTTEDEVNEEKEIGLAPVRLMIGDGNLTVSLNINDIWVPIITKSVEDLKETARNNETIDETVTAELLELTISNMLEASGNEVIPNTIQ